MGAAAGVSVSVLVPHVMFHDYPQSVFARFLPHSWDQEAWRERRGWILLQSGLTPAEFRGEYRLAWSRKGMEATP